MLKNSGFVHENIPFTIPNGASVPTAGLDIKGYTMFELIMPSAFTGTKVTFLTSDTLTGTYQPLINDSGIEVSIIVAAGKNTPITTDALALASSRFIKPRSGDLTTPVNQAADRAIVLSCKR